MAFPFRIAAALAALLAVAPSWAAEVVTYKPAASLELKAAFGAASDWRAVASQGTTANGPADVPVDLCFIATGQEKNCTFITAAMRTPRRS